MLKVTKNFTGCGFNFPDVGSLIQPRTEDDRLHLVGIGVAEPYEVKIEKPPAEVKKKKPSVSSQAAPRQRKKTQKKRTKSAKS